MEYIPQHLVVIEEIEKNHTPGLREILIEDGLEAVKFAMWADTGWHETHDPYVLGDRATEEKKRESWELSLRMKKIMATVLHAEYERMIEEIRQYEHDGPEVFHREGRE